MGQLGVTHRFYSKHLLSLQTKQLAQCSDKQVTPPKENLLENEKLKFI